MISEHIFVSPILVDFTDCTDNKRFLFSSEDSRFRVQTDGQVVVSKVSILDCKTNCIYVISGRW